MDLPYGGSVVRTATTTPNKPRQRGRAILTPSFATIVMHKPRIRESTWYRVLSPSFILMARRSKLYVSLSYCKASYGRETRHRALQVVELELSAERCTRNWLMYKNMTLKHVQAIGRENMYLYVIILSGDWVSIDRTGNMIFPSHR